MVLLVAFLTGLDNFLASSSIGPLQLDKKKKFNLACLFGFCEFMMPIIGFYFAKGFEAPEWLAPAALFACSALALLGWKFSEKFSKVAPIAVMFLPLFLSFDNLMAGVAFAAMDGAAWLSVLSVGFVSALLSLAGLFFGEAVSKRLSFNPQLTSGVALSVVAVLTVVLEEAL